MLHKAASNQTKEAAMRSRSPLRKIALAIPTTLLPGLLAVFAAQSPDSAKTDGVYYVAYRTPAHVSRSSPDVFHEVANGMLEFLKQNDVNIVADPERGTIQTSELFSTDSLLHLTKDAGANYLLYVTVDRPAASWLKVTFQCYDLSGKALWEEHASSAGGLSGKAAPSKAMENLKKKLLPRIGQPGLPKVPKHVQSGV
jgi:hypothetical protein